MIKIREWTCGRIRMVARVGFTGTKKTAAQGPCAAVQTSQMLQALFRDKNRIDYVNDTV